MGVTMTGLLAGVSAFPGFPEDEHPHSALGVFNCGLGGGALGPEQRLLPCPQKEESVRQ